MLDRTTPPAHYPIAGFKLISPDHLPFSNGVQAFVFDAGEQELVRIEWIFGNIVTAEDQALLNTALSELIVEGTSTLSSAKIAELVDFHGAFLVPEYGYDHTSLTLFSLNKHLIRLLPLVKSILTDAVFPEKELATYTRNNKQRLQVSLKKNSFVARRTFNTALFGETRYGFVPENSDYDSLTRDALLALSRKQFNPSNCTLVVAGKVTGEVLTMLEQLFGNDWQGDGSSTPGTSAPLFPIPAGQLIVDERADTMQSAIRIGVQSIQRAHPDFPGLQLLNTLFGGYFGSRLMMNIRENKGYTYNIGSGLASLKHSAFLTVASEVGVGVTRATLTEIEKEILKLRNELVSDTELELVRNYLMGAMLGSLDNVFSHADKFKNTYFSGLDLRYYDYYLEVVNTIRPQEIRRLAEQYLDYDQMTKVVVGSMA